MTREEFFDLQEKAEQWANKYYHYLEKGDQIQADRCAQEYGELLLECPELADLTKITIKTKKGKEENNKKYG